MPKPTKKERIVAQYFVWLLGRRNGIYVADGRSNARPAGRHSLGTRDRAEALANLQQLDRVIAVEHGLADSAILQTEASELLSLAEGRRLFEEYVKRPKIAGGPSAATRKRYRAVLDKFLPFAETQGLHSWNQVDRSVLEAYAAWLDGESYAYATEYLELTTIKQIVKWLIDNDKLSAERRIVMPLRKPEGTDTYCWRPEEIQAMVRHCEQRADLHWLGHILVALACTGLRISELAALRWSDLDLERGVVILADESTRAARRLRREPRSTKGRRGRSFPIHRSLRKVLDRMPRAKDGRVFHGPRGGVVKPDTARRILIRDVLTPLASQFPTAEGEIGFADGRLHSFRHYFCSTCANEGVPERVVMQWLGHRNSRMVQHYFHLHDDESQRQMRRLGFV